MPEGFGSREHHIVRIFQIGAAMVLLCAMSLATSVAAALRESAKTEAELHGLAEAVEVMKEILAQVSVNPGYKDHTAAASFCHCCLYTLRAILLDWSISTTAVQTMPLAKMPKIEGNAVWHVEHPNCRIFLAEQHAVPHPSFEGIRRRAMGMVCGFLRDVGISLGCLTQRIRGSKRRKSVLP